MDLTAQGKHLKEIDDFKSSSKGVADSKDAKFSNDEEYFYPDDKEEGKVDVPQVNIIEANIKPSNEAPVTAGLILDIKFELDRDVVAAYWTIKFLVDSCHKRMIKILGETEIEDYPDGESDMHFEVEKIDIDGIEPSTLANTGLLIAALVVNGEEVASLNMVNQIYSY